MPAGRLLPATEGKDDARSRPRWVPSLGRNPPTLETLTRSPAAVSDTDTDTTVWLVTGDPQHPAALSRAMQKQSEKINEVLLCPLALQEQHEEGVRTLPEPRTKASKVSPKPVHPNLIPSRIQTPRESGAAVPAPCRRARPRLRPQTRQKVIIPRNCWAGENKSRKDVKGGEDA